jgi:hypothetical protein
MRRQRILPIAVLVLCVIALVWWAMLMEKAVDPPPAAAVVQVEPPPVASSPAVAEPAPAVEEKPKLPAGAILRGRVIDAATREPVRKFTLHYHWDRSTGYRQAPPARTFDTGDGRFELADATPGVWSIIASARGFQRFELEGVRLRPGETTPEIVMPLRRGHAVKGRVYDEATGVGIAAASVNFRESEAHRFGPNWRIRDSFAVRSQKSGSFVLEGVPSGRITISAGVGGYAAREVEIVVGDETGPVEIALFVGGSISGRLTAADGVTPIAGSAGLFYLDQGFGGSSRTAQSGEFSYPNLPAGRYKITGQAEGMTAEQEITLAANERIEGIVLALGTGHSIRGVVTGLRPETLERVEISWDNGGGGGPQAPVRVDARGAYELRGIPPGRVYLGAEVRNSRSLARTVEMPRDRDLTVNFEFPSGARLSGRVTHRGKPVVGATVNPRQPRTQGELSIDGATTTAQGDYVIEDLPPGEYFLRIANYRSRLIQVADDMVFDMDVPSAQLSGRVLEAGGKVPVSGAEVVIWWTEDPARIRQFANTDHLGRFVIVGLEPGDFVLSAHKSGYGLYREPFSFSAPVADMTIRLDQGKGVEAQVRHAISGKPLRSMNLHVVETIRGRHGISLSVTLDENGVGYVPSGLAGSTLSFGADGYAVAEVREWSGDELRLKFTPQ